MAEVEDGALVGQRVRMPQSHEQGDRLGLVELFIPALVKQLTAGLALLALVFQIGIRWFGPSALVRPPVSRSSSLSAPHRNGLVQRFLSWMHPSSNSGLGLEGDSGYVQGLFRWVPLGDESPKLPAPNPLKKMAVG